MIGVTFSENENRRQAFGTETDTAAITKMIDRFQALPAHIARKHLQAAMRRVLKPAVPILKRNTPPLGSARGRRKKGARKKGALKKAVTVRVGKRGTMTDGFVFGVLGYKQGMESRKAIWLEFGTRYITPQRMIDKTMSQFGGVAAQKLEAELVTALDKAVKEFGAGKNPGFGG